MLDRFARVQTAFEEVWAAFRPTPPFPRPDFWPGITSAVRQTGALDRTPVALRKFGAALTRSGGSAEDKGKTSGSILGHRAL